MLDEMSLPIAGRYLGVADTTPVDPPTMRRGSEPLNLESTKDILGNDEQLASHRLPAPRGVKQHGIQTSASDEEVPAAPLTPASPSTSDDHPSSLDTSLEMSPEPRRQSTPNQSKSVWPPDSVQRSTRNLYVSGLHPNTQNTDLMQMFSPYGHIVSAKAVMVTDRPWECQGYGFVMFENGESASFAMSELSQKTDMLIQFAKLAPRRRSGENVHEDPTNLYFSSLPLSYTEHHLKAMLEPYGRVVSCRILRDFDTQSSRGVGFARMKSHHVCKTILEEFSGMYLEGSAEPLICKFADTPRSKGHRSSVDTAEYRASLQQMCTDSAGYWSPQYHSMGGGVLMPLSPTMLVSPYGQPLVARAGAYPYSTHEAYYGTSPIGYHAVHSSGLDPSNEQ
eukprot:m.263132 g.263132  ORF g.263132 m.263132 type:complete len:393 (-) comp26703_c0_seq1:4363-5541(-)